MPRCDSLAAADMPAMPAPMMTTRGSGKLRSALQGSTPAIPRSSKSGPQSQIAGDLFDILKQVGYIL